MRIIYMIDLTRYELLLSSLHDHLYLQIDLNPMLYSARPCIQHHVTTNNTTEIDMFTITVTYHDRTIRLLADTKAHANEMACIIAISDKENVKIVAVRTNGRITNKITN